MTKLLFNRKTLIDVDDNKILQGFAKSHIIKDYSDSPEEVRLALFVAFDEPVGLGSTFRSSKEFNKLFDKRQPKAKLFKFKINIYDYDYL
jgi:hypothetical protein